MPTGYTAGVADGTITTFPEFAMRCARSFGALIEMRDSPSDAPIPDAFEPSTYHRERIAEARAELARLEAMTPEEIQAGAEEANREAMESWERRVREDCETRQRYEAMLTEARAWEPPSPEHRGMKTFMVEQLEESIRYDATKWERPEPETPEDWHSDRIAKAARDIAYHTEEDRKERERTAERNRWVRLLRESLEGYATPVP